MEKVSCARFREVKLPLDFSLGLEMRLKVRMITAGFHWYCRKQVEVFRHVKRSRLVQSLLRYAESFC